MNNEIINNAVEAAADAVAQNTEVVKTVGTKTVAFFGITCAAIGVIVDETVRFIVKKCESKKDLGKEAKKGWKLLKRKTRDAAEVVGDTVEDVVDGVQDLLEEK